MRASSSRPGRMVWAFLLATAVCLASGEAVAMCTPSLTGIIPGNGDVRLLHQGSAYRRMYDDDLSGQHNYNLCAV